MLSAIGIPSGQAASWPIRVWVAAEGIGLTDELAAIFIIANERVINLEATASTEAATLRIVRIWAFLTVPAIRAHHRVTRGWIKHFATTVGQAACTSQGRYAAIGERASVERLHRTPLLLAEARVGLDTAIVREAAGLLRIERAVDRRRALDPLAEEHATARFAVGQEPLFTHRHRARQAAGTGLRAIEVGALLA